MMGHSAIGSRRPDSPTGPSVVFNLPSQVRNLRTSELSRRPEIGVLGAVLAGGESLTSPYRWLRLWFVSYCPCPTDDDEEMRGVGGPLLTIGDLLSDLAVDGGDDPLVGVGDASVLSSPSVAEQAGKAEPSDLTRLFEEHYNNLMKALQDNDPSWPSLMLKLCAALRTADKLVDCANTNAEQLLVKVKELEGVLERSDHAVAEIVEALQRSGLAKDHQSSQSKLASK